MVPSVGNLDILSLEPCPRSWVIGAAPTVLPYWPLFNEAGERIARFVLLFESDESATEEIRRYLDEEFRPTNGHEPLMSYMQRAARDVTASRRASVATVELTLGLSTWMRQVMGDELDR